MEIITDHETLSRNFLEIRDELDEAEKSLTKLLGRGRNNFSVSSTEFQSKHIISSCKNLFFQASNNKRKLSNSPDSVEESASEDELTSKKIGLRSAVITKEAKSSRKDIILKQNCNTKIRLRNRRMLGMVQSTLKKFQDESVKRQSQELKKIEVEQRVEAAEEEKKRLIERQKMELFSKRKQKLLQLDCLKEMMELTESFGIWESNQKYLLNYIITEAEPKICFLPASHTSSSKKHLKRSKANIEEIMLKQRAAIERELAMIKESYQSIPVKSEVQVPVIQDDRYNALEQITESACTGRKKNSEGNLSLHISEDELMYSD